MILWSCGDEDTVNRSDQEYFPLQTGFYQVYTVEENVYSEINPDQSFSYELKTEVVDSFPNPNGDFTYVIHRSKRNLETDPWQFLDAWSARMNISQAVLNEGNISYIKIAFPATKNHEWNGNALNALEEDSYKIENAGGTYTLETNDEFKDVLIINQAEEVNQLIRDEREEVYARNIGLIYKKSIVINYCDDVSCFGQQIITDGVEYWQVLKEYGQN